MVAHVGFVGLGNIGSRVAPHLLNAGHRLAVSDLNTAAVEALVAQGARAAESAADTARDADIVILSLPSPAIVRTVVAGNDGVLAGAKPGTIIVDHSTIDPETAREVAGLAAAVGVTYLDAPVSGGVQGAEAGTLSIMAGGDAGAFERVRPVLESYSGNVFLVGETGSGQAIKLANNIITAINIAALGEGLSAAVGAGVDLDTAAKVLSTSSANSHVLSSYFPRTLFTEDRPTGFALDFMLKDIKLFLNSTAQTALPTPVSNVVGDLFRIGNRDGRGAKDFTSVVEFYEDFTGTRLQTKGN
ncbi:NAD(P)-dependent oxidoreductase [Leucobacter sp. 7(1)]|uniref:NAD(P)-dependent oxidoreductase n=1 Tax=Leucobacter sp. 7(1) TaxID=1255613 RepID=UPI000B3532A4|nr:NAD(P)-dependent oxidoreductase [Leucobacter sp. 7(1)]